MAFNSLTSNQMVSQLDLVSSFNDSSPAFVTNLKGSDLTYYINNASNRWVTRSEADRTVSISPISGDQEKFVVKSEMIAVTGKFTYLLRSNISTGTNGQCNIKIDDMGGSGVVINSDRNIGTQEDYFRVTSVGDDITVIVTHTLSTLARVVVSSLDGTNATSRTVPANEVSTFYGIIKRDILVSISSVIIPPAGSSPLLIKYGANSDLQHLYINLEFARTLKSDSRRQPALFYFTDPIITNGTILYRDAAMTKLAYTYCYYISSTDQVFLVNGGANNTNYVVPQGSGPGGAVQQLQAF